MATRRTNTIFVPEEGDSRLIISGPRGVTKHQMIAAINRNIDIPNNIAQLAESYPNTFFGSLQYVKKAVRLKAYEIVGEPDTSLDQEKFELLQVLKPSRKGVTYNQIIPVVEKASTESNYVLINQIKKHFPEQFAGSLKYIPRKYHSAIETALNMDYEVNEDANKLVARA